MAKRGNRIIKWILIVLGCLAIAILVLNWILTYRLEKYLKDELGNMVVNATDGFYHLDFSDLKIDFFSGELLIKDINLYPDSVEYKRLAALDSLPSIQVDIAVGSIHFKGINLTWRRKYTKLHFDLFEINNVNLNVYENRSATEKDTITTLTPAANSSLHDLISPYISVLTAKSMSLEHASFFYHVQDVSDSATYALTDVDFNVYGFRLDKDSYSSGKLLYSENFEFKADKPQVLLSNSQFEMNTRNILLSTRDSVILIEGLHFHPQESLLEDSVHYPISYADAKVEKLKVSGILFKRINALNFLNARSFDIVDSRIKYFDTGNSNSSVNANDIDKDSLIYSWSLYSLISPVLHEVSIDRIRIDSAELNYAIRQDNKTDFYTIDRFKFEAKGFKVDSLSDSNFKLLYSDNFSIDGFNINGDINSRNHKAGIEHLYIGIDSLATDCRLDNITVKPINRTLNEDCLDGTIYSIDIVGLKYSEAVEVDHLLINKPIIKFNKSEKSHNVTNQHKGQKKQFVDELFSPLFGHLLIKNIDLTDADITYINNIDRDVFNLRNFYLHATGFLANENTMSKPSVLLDYVDFSFSFKNFDNLIFNKKYRLKIGDAGFSNRTGDLKLKSVSLIPQDSVTETLLDTYYEFSVPEITLTGIDYKNDDESKKLLVDSFYIHSPKIVVHKSGRKIIDKANLSKEQKINFNSLNVNTIFVDNPDVRYIDSVAKDTVNISSDMLILNGVQKMQKSLSWNLLFLPNLKFGLKQSEKIIDFRTNLVSIDEAEWQSGEKINIHSFSTLKPKLKYTILKPAIDTASVKNKDIYNSLQNWAKDINIGRIYLEDACFDYIQTGDTIGLKDSNETNLFVTGLAVNTNKKSFYFDDLEFDTKSLQLPVDKGFYTLSVGNLAISKQDSSLRLNNMQLLSKYPKMEFAYKHPLNKDWFDVKVGHIGITGIDVPTYFKNNILNIRTLEVKDTELQNFKNQKIHTPKRIPPPIYAYMQKLPFELNINTVDVVNFGVVYEELTKAGSVPGKIFLTEMNGHFDKFTNSANYPDQYNVLKANGKLMGTGYFDATWMVPVDSSFDQFEIEAHLPHLEFKDLNQLIAPMAPAKVSGGVLDNLTFNTIADSVGAWIDMQLLYHDLRMELFKQKNGELVENRFVTNVVNQILKSKNPDKPNRKPRQPSVVIIRDPYHSTFNYIWQILQPPVIESVGVSKGKQDFAKSAGHFFGKVKKIFSFGWLKKEKKKEEQVPQK